MARRQWLGGAVLILGSVSALGGAPLEAQVSTQIADLARGPSFFEPSIDVHVVHELGDRLLFPVTLLSTEELWSSDGTPEGTFQLTAESQRSFGSSPVLIAQDRGLQVWLLQGEYGGALWRTDGSRRGTALLSRPEPADFKAKHHVNASGRFPIFENGLFYPGQTPEGDGLFAIDLEDGSRREVLDLDPETRFLSRLALLDQGVVALDRDFEQDLARLWMTDRAGASPRLLGSYGAFDVDDLAAIGGLAVLMVRSGAEWNIWRTDGTAAGTRPISGVGKSFSTPSSFETIDGVAYWLAETPQTGREIWRTDGTSAGTFRLSDLPPTRSFLFSELRLNVGYHDGFLVVPVTGGEVVAIDSGTGATQSLATGCPLSRGSSDDSLFASVEAGLIFTCVQGRGALWVTDGRPQGTRFHHAFSESFSCPSSGRPPAAVGGSFFFVDCDSREIPQLWMTNGQAGDLRKLTSFTSDTAFHTSLDRLGIAGSRVVFVAEEPPHGAELRYVDLTTGEGGLILDIASRNSGSSPFAFAEVGSSVVFLACPGDSEVALWSQSTEGVELLADGMGFGCDDSSRPQLLGLGSRALILTRDELWSTDGTRAGTSMLRRLTSFSDKVLGRLGNRGLYLDNEAIWTSDGTPGGTMKLKELGDLGLSNSRGLLQGGRYLYGTSDSGFNERYLWRTDGTAGGTILLVSAPGLSQSSSDLQARPVAQVDGRDVLVLGDQDRGAAIWISDGSPGGTRVVKESGSTFGSVDFYSLTAFGNRFFFWMEDSEPARELWISDGTAAGSKRLAEFTIDLLEKPWPLVVGGRLFFAGGDEIHGRELWVSDGTPEGTRLFKDLRPGIASSSPAQIAEQDGRLLVVAGDDSYGRELHAVSMATGEATLLHDINPGPAGSDPRELARIGTSLYFSADDGYSGREPYELPSLGSLPCERSDRALCLKNERFRVEARWRNFQSGTGEGTAVALTSDTGYFWFFKNTNVEAVVKVLDGNPINGHFWTFFGALSNVEYALTVTDTQTGLTRRYFNPPRRFASVGDTESFGPRGAKSAVVEASGTAGEPLLVEHYFDPTLLKMACVSGPRRLCLNGGRFAVTANWENFQGMTGVGTAVPLTSDTGYFWFFKSSNVEVVLKVLDGRVLNNHYWVFYGALSNVAYRLTVTDTETGEVKVYENPARRFASVGDTEAFAGN